MKTVGFEYQSKRGATAFEIFLRHTDEKERSSIVLGRILRRLLTKKGMSLLDVGAGNGEYLKLALNRAKIAHRITLTLLEPSRSLVKQLRRTAQQFPSNLITFVRQLTLEEYDLSDRFDVILASHLPFPKGRLGTIYAKMLTRLKPGGSLIVVLRNRDDVHDFRTRFKSRLLGATYRSLTIEDAVDVLTQLGRIVPLRISRTQARASLQIPLLTKYRDARTIIEFLLNKKWKDYPENIRREILEYLKRREGFLRIYDGFALVKK